MSKSLSSLATIFATALMALCGFAAAAPQAPVVDGLNGNGLARSALSAVNALAVRGNIAVVDRRGCDYVVKARMCRPPAPSA
mgnify:CR=1 FL=1|jgi:hypothetical protein